MSKINLYKRLIGVVNIIKDTNNDQKRIIETQNNLVNGTNAINSELTNLKNEVSVLKSELTDFKNEVSVLKSELTDFKNEVSVLKSEISMMKNEMTELNSKQSKMIKIEGIDTSPYCNTDSLSFKSACFANELHNVHKESFSEFKGINEGKSVVIVGTGSTMKYYKSIPGIPHIGVNKSFLNPNIKLDYYFTTDNENKDGYFQKLIDYDFVKFFGQYPTGTFRDIYQFSEEFIRKNNGRRFYQSEPNEDINIDLEYHPLMGFYSVIFQAIHFALYIGSKKLILVGCDCAYNGYYDDTAQSENTPNAVKYWKNGYIALNKFLKQFYPSVEVISINPIGLKGLFHDVYSLDYLKDNDLNSDDYELFDEKYIKRLLN